MNIRPWKSQETAEERLRKIVPLTAYVVWDIDGEHWFKPSRCTNQGEDIPNHCVLVHGVWGSEETAHKDITIENYTIVTIDMSDKIPADIKRLMNLSNDFGVDEKKSLILVKFSQLIQVFVFRNQDMIKQMKETYKEEKIK